MPTVKGSSDQAKIDRMVTKAFAAKGITDAIPRINVKTFNKWVAEGRRPKEGEKSVRVRQFRLFHLSQTRALTKEEITSLAEKPTSDRLPTVPPVETKAEIKPKVTAAKTAKVTPLKPKGKSDSKDTDQPQLGL